MANPLNKKNAAGPPSRRATKLDRIPTDTSDKATKLAKQWGITKQEFYRWLVDLAWEGEIKPVFK